MKPTLGQRVVSAGLGAVFQHVLENTPEIVTLARAIANEAPRANPRPVAPVVTRNDKKKRRPPPQPKRVDEDDVIDLEKKFDGTYGAKS